MKLITTFGLLLLLLFACKLCSVTGEDSKRFDPYRGSLTELLPKSTTISGGNLEQQSVAAANIKTAKEALRAQYKYTNRVFKLGVRINCTLVNYDSAQAADAAIREAAQRDNATLQPKNKNGRTVGQRYVATAHETLLWSNGSIVSQISGAGIKVLEEFETAMVF